MHRTRICAVLAALSIHSATLSAQEPVTQPRLRVSGVELSVGGRVQTQFNTTSIDGVAPSQLFIRRARIELAVKVDDRISGVLQPDFANDEVQLKDAYLMLQMSPGFQVLAGKAHRPFGLIEQTSSKRMLPIERGLRIRGLAAADEYALLNRLAYSDRDIGLQLLGRAGHIGYGAGVFRGPLHGEVGAQDSYQFAGRVTVSPLRSLRLGAGWSSRDFIVGDGDTPQLDRGHAFEIDLEYGAFAPGLHVIAEVSRGDLDPALEATFEGAHLWIAFRTKTLGAGGVFIEPLFRASYASTDADLPGDIVPGGTLMTPGVNIYFGPLNRLMLNYDVWNGAAGSPDAQSFKAMFQLGF